MREVILGRSKGMVYKAPYPKIQEQMRNKYKVREGDLVRLRVESNDRKSPKDMTEIVRVTRIDRYHVTVRMGAGFLRSYRWFEFVRLRTKLSCA